MLPVIGITKKKGRVNLCYDLKKYIHTLQWTALESFVGSYA